MKADEVVQGESSATKKHGKDKARWSYLHRVQHHWGGTFFREKQQDTRFDGGESESTGEGEPSRGTGK
jgi:hypothetical protein